MGGRRSAVPAGERGPDDRDREQGQGNIPNAVSGPSESNESHDEAAVILAVEPAGPDWAAAGQAAFARALECQRRVDALKEPGASSTRSDVARAQARMLSALRRALTARRRLTDARERRQARESMRRMVATSLYEPSVLPRRLDGVACMVGTGGALRMAVDSGAVTVHNLWEEFVAVGGDTPPMEFDAYLNGAWVMPSQDRRVLEHVWWEMEHLG